MAHPWELDWDAIVAIGTFTLALATVILAWKTKTLADESAQEIQAQNRPILLPTLGSVVDRPVRILPTMMYVQIRNVGSGPALDVVATVGDEPSTPWDAAAVAVGDEVEISFEPAHDLSERPRVAVTLEYRDLAGASHATQLPVEPIYDESDRVVAHRFVRPTVETTS